MQDHLPEKLRSTVTSRMRRAYHAEGALAAEFDRTHPGAASSLREGLAETLTVLRLNVSPTLARTLRSTNDREHDFYLPDPREQRQALARRHGTRDILPRGGESAFLAAQWLDMTLPSTTGAKDPADAVFTWCRTMLDTQPVHLDDDQLWHVFSYADVTRILSDPATFSSDTTVFNPSQPDVDLFLKGNIGMMDPPRHRKLRRLVSQVFTPRVVAAMAPRITEITTSLLNSLDVADRFDLVDALAHPLPITVIAELLGVPAQDQPRFRSWTEAIFNQPVDATTIPTEELVNTVAPTIRDMNEYLLAHVQRRREQPTDDLIGKLTVAEVDGEQLSAEEIVSLAGVLLLAGHVTTTALLGNAVLSFDQHPAAAAAVRANRNLLPAAIEETLRYRPPFPRQDRVTTTDTEIGGRAVPAGQLMVLWVAAANRDAARFPEPDRFDVHRDSTGHLAFGYGIHFCIGAPLARLEAKIALNILLERYHDIAVDTASIEFHNPWGMISVKRLSVLVA